MLNYIVNIVFSTTYCLTRNQVTSNKALDYVEDTTTDSNNEVKLNNCVGTVHT